jgi:hypothetical protein
MRMKHNHLVICFLGLALFLCGRIATAQTQSQIEQRYPKLNSYRAKSNVAMTVRFSSNGEVCEMVLEPRHWDGKEFFLYPTIEESDVLTLVEETVPLSERGERVKDPVADLMALSGNSFSQAYHYEKLTIHTAGLLKPSGIMSAVITWQNRSCDK